MRWFQEGRVGGNETREGGLPRVGAEQKRLHVLPTNAPSPLWAALPTPLGSLCLPPPSTSGPSTAAGQSHPVNIAVK